MNRELLPQPSLYQFVLAKSDGLLARMLRSINERVDQCGGLPAKSDALRIMAVKEAAFSEIHTGNLSDENKNYHFKYI